MAVKKVLIYPDKVLRKPCSDVTEFDTEEFYNMILDMVDTLAAYRALGLSAPQIGISKRVFVTNVDNRPQFFINPRIVRAEGRITEREGCLSFPNVFERVERFAELTIDAIDASGAEFRAQLDGMDAVAAQHEYDHLDGVLFIDNVSPLARKMMIKKLGKFKKKFGLK